MSVTAAPSPTTANGLRGHLSALLRPSRRLLSLVAVLVLVSAAFELLPPLLMRSIIDEHLAAGRSEGLFTLALIYLAAVALGHALAFAYGYLAAGVAQGILSRLRVRLFAHLQSLPAAYHDHNPLGDLISRCTADVDTLDSVFTSGIAALVANLFRVLMVAVAMVILSPMLALAAAAALPPLIVITRFFQVRIRRAERESRRAVGEMNAHLQETLRGVEVIQAFGRETTFVARFRRVLVRALDAYNRSTVYASVYPPLTAFMTYGAIALLLWVGTRDLNGAFGASIGTLAAFALLLQRFFQPVTALGDEWQTVQSALSGAERIFEVLSFPTEPQPRSTPTRTQSNGIVCTDVVFGYRTNAPILHGVTLRVAPGEHVAIVGRTGAGKSSIVHLLAGLYEPWRGSISVAGRNPRTLSDAEKPGVFGIVPQATQIFGGTVLDNLTLNDERISESAVREAAIVTGADRVIGALPEGYRTVLRGAGGGFGVQLSAGQQQLLGLTRALVRRPPVLLFDEATSFMDGATEGALRQALRSALLVSGSAVLTVAHRLTTAKEADRVVLIDSGRVVEQGCPSDLIACGGHFAALVELEAAGWDWQAGSSAPLSIV